MLLYAPLLHQVAYATSRSSQWLQRPTPYDNWSPFFVIKAMSGMLPVVVVSGEKKTVYTTYDLNLRSVDTSKQHFIKRCSVKWHHYVALPVFRLCFLVHESYETLKFEPNDIDSTQLITYSFWWRRVLQRRRCVGITRDVSLDGDIQRNHLRF